MMRLRRRDAVLAAVLGLTTFPASAAFFKYLYIEASEGNASGGHAAIQFGDDIYHFQHIDAGLIRLFRQPQDDFQFRYRYLQNRPVHESRIEVSEDTFERLQNQFNREFLSEQQLYKLLAHLNKERIFIRYLLHRLDTGPSALTALAELRLKSAGFRNPKHLQTDSALTRSEALSIQKLCGKLKQHYGSDYLPHRRDKLEKKIAALLPTHWPKLPDQFLSNQFPPSVYTLTDRYLDAMTDWLALKVIAEAVPLRTGAFFQMQQSEFTLSEAERRSLQALRDRLENRLLHAIASERPDWGYAVLVNLARYLAVEHSLQTGHWFFIDDFAETSPTVRPDDYAQHRNALQVLLIEARRDINAIRQTAASVGSLTEQDYERLEAAANRYAELSKSRQSLPFRYHGIEPLPPQTLPLPDGPVPALSRRQLTESLAALERFQQQLTLKMTRVYHYDLIRRNCVTELFRNINRALAKLDDSTAPTSRTGRIEYESEKRLGGYIDVPTHFIPFVAYQAVQQHYRVSNSHDLSSYRQQELRRLNARQNPLFTVLTESNIVSSSLYHYNPDDALFLFFTDDTVALRPVFGAFNTVAGIGQSVFGLFSWPFDSGKNLKSGAVGFLMSLPELAFFNIRKGTYRYLSYRLMSKTH